MKYIPEQERMNHCMWKHISDVQLIFEMLADVCYYQIFIGL